MFSSIFTKTLYERRWSTLIWMFAVFGFTLLTMMLFPSLRDSLGASLQDVPESMRELLGSAEDYQTITGFVDLQIIAQMVFFTLIMGVIAGTSLVAGEENSGNLQTLLAQPVRRVRVYLEKYAALSIMVAIVTFGLFFGVIAGVLILGETINIFRLLAASAMVWLVTMFFATLAYSVGAFTGKRGVAGVVAGAYAFVGYMLTALAGAADALEKLNYASPFYYFNTPSVLREGFDLGNIAVLCFGIIIFIILGLLRFIRRNIFLR